VLCNRSQDLLPMVASSSLNTSRRQHRRQQRRYDVGCVKKLTIVLFCQLSFWNHCHSIVGIILFASSFVAIVVRHCLLHLPCQSTINSERRKRRQILGGSEQLCERRRNSPPVRIIMIMIIASHHHNHHHSIINASSTFVVVIASPSV